MSSTRKTQAPPGREARLRAAAETKLARRGGAAPGRSPLEAAGLVHELEVHQIELEMQNEELHRAQGEAAAAAEKYAELFDFAPVGYFVLGEDGKIREANLAGAALLGLERQRVMGQPFEQYVVSESRLEFSRFYHGVLPGQGRCSYGVRLLQQSEGPRDVLMEITVAETEAEGPRYRLAVIDITAHKHSEERVRQLNAELEQKVAARTADLGVRNRELTQLNSGMIGRELRMVELKREINELCQQVGLPPRYPRYAEEDPPS